MKNAMRRWIEKNYIFFFELIRNKLLTYAKGFGLDDIFYEKPVVNWFKYIHIRPKSPSHQTRFSIIHQSLVSLLTGFFGNLNASNKDIFGWTMSSLITECALWTEELLNISKSETSDFDFWDSEFQLAYLFCVFLWNFAETVFGGWLSFRTCEKPAQ